MIKPTAIQYPVGASTFPSAESAYEEQKSLNLYACFFNKKKKQPKTSTLHIFFFYPSKHAEAWHEQVLIHFHRLAHGWSCPRSHQVQSWLSICFHRPPHECQGCLLINCPRNQESGLNPRLSELMGVKIKLQHLYHTETWLAGSQPTLRSQHRNSKNADYSTWALNCQRELTRHTYAHVNFLSIKG